MSKFEQEFVSVFMTEIDHLIDDGGLSQEVRQKLFDSANRVSALVEIAIRTPHRADSIKESLEMEKGIIETALAHAAVDATQAIQDAAVAAAKVLIEAALL